MNGRWILAAYLATAALGGGPALADPDPDRGDIREIRVGMDLAKVPQNGYSGFRCADKPEITLSGWDEFTRCGTDASGFHAVRFDYDEAKNSALARLGDRWEGTKVAGHPAILTMLISNDRTVQGLRIATDPKARAYYRKKAFLLGLRVRERYGEDGWTCSDAPAATGESDVGGMFIKKDCEKLRGDRRVILHTRLYRTPKEQGTTDFESATEVEILHVRS